MRRSDFEQTFLNEAIDTSAIDLAARKVLHDDLIAWLKADWDHFIQAYPDADQHDLYDSYYQWKKDNGHNLFIKQLCTQAGESLTRITREQVQKAFGKEIKINLGKGLDGRYIGASSIEVFVQARELTTDDHKKYGGYFQGSGFNPYIVCNVNLDDVWYAAMGLVQIIAVGEGEGYDLLANTITPTFVHEYTHLEQLLRGDPFAAEDFGYITVGGGKRGGRRDPGNGTVGWLRYKSSAKEIEAFATGAASELIDDATRYRYSSTPGMEDSQIKSILEAIAMGYADTRSIRGYTAIAWGTWTEEAERLGVPSYEIHETYRRFLKKVYQHVWNYRQKRIGSHGKEKSWHIYKAPDRWKAWAKKLPMRDCAMHIAQDIANDLLVKYSWGDGEQFRRYSEEISNGALFLLDAFFRNEDEYNDSRDTAVEASFKSLVIRLFDKERQQQRLQDAA